MTFDFIKNIDIGSPLPRVSLGMPVYNGEKFIGQAIESLLAQTFTDYELIISDNFSTDETEHICREYAARDARIRYVRQRKNVGAHNNFRFVLDESNGEYFKWMAADDFLGTPESLGNLVKVLEDGHDLAIPDVNIIDERNGVTQKAVLTTVFDDTKRNPMTELALLYSSFQIYGLFLTVKLKKLLFLLNRDADLKCFGEGVFVHAVSAELNCTFVGDALLIYRQHNTNISSTITPPVLFVSFLKYTSRVFKLYLNSAFSADDKFIYLMKLGFIHSKYLLYLIAASGKHFCCKIIPIKLQRFWH